MHWKDVRPLPRSRLEASTRASAGHSSELNSHRVAYAPRSPAGGPPIRDARPQTAEPKTRAVTAKRSPPRLARGSVAAAGTYFVSTDAANARPAAKECRR